MKWSKWLVVGHRCSTFDIWARCMEKNTERAVCARIYKSSDLNVKMSNDCGRFFSKLHIFFELAVARSTVPLRRTTGSRIDEFSEQWPSNTSISFWAESHCFPSLEKSTCLGEAERSNRVIQLDTFKPMKPILNEQHYYMYTVPSTHRYKLVGR